jgi:esterase/lipase superfamily enzyme
LVGYPVDENNVAWSAGHLKQFLGELVEASGADAINVVAHSMGNRAMTAALQQMWFERQTTAPEEPAPFDRVVLAAPDVDADLFRRDFAPALVDLADQVTLYASSDDQALRASKAVHGYPRAGESGAAIVVVPGVETIDVSGIDLSLLGHSYYGDSESMLRDLYHVLDARLPAAERTALVPRPFGELRYWQLLHEATQMR